jgi:hypothetical protein
MKKNLLKAVVLVSSLALSTSAFAITPIDGNKPLEMKNPDGVVIATIKTSTGVTMSVGSTPTLYGVVGKHLSGDTVFIADSLDSTTRIETTKGAKDAANVGLIPTITADPTLDDTSTPASITVAYDLAAAGD